MTPFKISSLEEVVMVHKTQFELNPTIQNRERLYKVQAELFRFLALEEEFWKQKAGMSWFNDGDRNTKLFHAQVNGRRKRLQLKRIQNNDDVWIDEKEAMAHEAVKFFNAQFCEQLINKAKSTVYMHHLTNEGIVRMVERITGIERGDFSFTYLGCPIFYARRKMDYCQ